LLAGFLRARTVVLLILVSLYLFSVFSLIERFFIYFSRRITETIYLPSKKSKHMTLADVTEQFQAVAAKAPNLGKSLKFAFDEGVVFLDLTSDDAVVSNEDKEADCTITTTIETLEGIRNGSVNPMIAMMGGKVKIKGDMGLAMQLQSLLS
jgi:putative sterol carrier protein